MSYPTSDPNGWQTPPVDPYQTQYGYGYGYPATQPTNPLAVTGLVLAILGVFIGITAPVGAIMGHVARRQIRAEGGQGDGLALGAVITGWIATALWALAIAIPVVFFIL